MTEIFPPNVVCLGCGKLIGDFLALLSGITLCHPFLQSDINLEHWNKFFRFVWNAWAKKIHDEWIIQLGKWWSQNVIENIIDSKQENKMAKKHNAWSKSLQGMRNMNTAMGWVWGRHMGGKVQWETNGTRKGTGCKAWETRGEYVYGSVDCECI